MATALSTPRTTIWSIHNGETGNADKSADFNRNGCVDSGDYVIWRKYKDLPLLECASRFEGDANRDGAVDQADYNIWLAQFGNCGSGSSALGAGGGELTSAGTGQVPESPDMDGDGDVDASDLAALDEAILGGAQTSDAAALAEPAAAAEPTLAE
ncbi:MAG: hypothetical protein L0228_14560 [Planctomycetes bacterium]|nr:hypothetical protein [Planctomycetota bacterium]